MILRIDFDSEMPIYLQIKNQIIQGIAKKEIEDGEELPSVRGLAEDIGVNMHTVNKAYAMLKDDGYIKIDRRKGAVVSLSLENTTNRFKDSLNLEMEYYMAECFNRGISKEEIKKDIDEIFRKFK
ncbi:GntR family transcriptional regulator [Clostridium chauvoei]|uniref:GntR family transcriptional regulator n=2 Tax=Clostridium chauvoei TaxID=46867 RepID=A0ABD4RG08_9CLOT|nr:GntR family transcriptional regulator [Clostridium chauvoei]ATD55675.1 GntR family transcriptional regulator [Clostridium chauvoei]ATD56648.1 GntR family transcriptional regulator [Clostridium chauvoei]MBX7280085.1 GntR family transcriptional regulator [Clostridium chauvoei]MBX7282569.1 GntR family transcriptional regulator [Clostridium chauvoei]MBX7284976.1 GntR family transcriptional regulator [Clostridium chauvoei]